MAIRERKPRVWQVRVYAGVDRDTGKEIWDAETVHGGRRAAEKREREMKTAASKRTVTTSTRTLSQAAGEIIDHLEDVGRAPKTIHEYRRLLAILDADRLGRRPLSEITTRDVDAYYARLGKTTGRAGKKRGASAIVPHHRFLRSVGNWAVRWDWWESNPIARATPPRKVTARRQPAPADHVVREIFTALDEQRDKTRGTAARVEAVLGCRRGELCALRWPDVDLTNGAVHVHGAVDTTPDAPRLKDTKTHQNRTVPIDERTAALLRHHRILMQERALKVGGKLARAAFVFSDDPLCREPLDPDRLSNAWRRARDKAGHPTVRLQDVRGWAGSTMIEAGEDISVVSDLLGHADPATTRRFYVRATTDAASRSAEIRGRILDDDMRSATGTSDD